MAMAEMVRRWAWAVMVLALAGCPSELDDYEACGAACDACGLGYCVAGGGSGHCSDPGRARCIIDAPDCNALSACVGGPDAGLVDAAVDDYAACGAACDVCGLGYCVAGGGSGHCSDPERARCILDAPDCDALRACVAGP